MGAPFHNDHADRRTFPVYCELPDGLSCHVVLYALNRFLTNHPLSLQVLCQSSLGLRLTNVKSICLPSVYRQFRYLRPQTSCSPFKCQRLLQCTNRRMRHHASLNRPDNSEIEFLPTRDRHHFPMHVVESAGTIRGFAQTLSLSLADDNGMAGREATGGAIKLSRQANCVAVPPIQSAKMVSG